MNRDYSNNTLNQNSQVEQQRQVIEKLKASNDKLQRKLEYYENFLENIVQFEKSQNILNMKAFTKANLQKFDSLIEECYRSKEELEIERMTAAELRAKLNMRHMQDFSSSGTSSQTGLKSDASGLGQEKIMKLETQVKTMTKEMDSLTEKNKRLVQSLSKKDFFNEYELLLKEVEGLRKQNLMMQEKLKAKSENNI